MIPVRHLLSLVVAVGFVGCVTSPKHVGTATTGKRMTVRTTAYTHTEAGGRANAIGGVLRFGAEQRSAASDWSWLPLGTRFKMLSSGKEYVIEDYGSALVGKQTIDLYFPTRKAMRDWGVRQEQIEILEWGSEAMSLKLLEPRTRNRHVAAMVAQLRKQGTVPSTQKTFVLPTPEARRSLAAVTN
jgi:3D (Asp-Asp-Asp) domain-containing protein